jgi:hypothetical protein
MKTKRGPRGPYRNSTADRIRRLHAQGVSVDDITKRTGTSRGYVMTVTCKIQTVAQKKAQDEVERKEAEAKISEALYRAAFEKETGIPASQNTIAEAEPTPEVKRKMNNDLSYKHENRTRRHNERISPNLVLLHTYFENPDRVYSTYRYEYVSPIHNGNRSKFLGTAQEMTLAEAWKAVTRYNKIVANGKDPFPLGIRATGLKATKKVAILITPPEVAPAPPIVVSAPAALRDEPEVKVAEEPVFVPPFLKETPVYKNESEYKKAKGDKQLIKPVPPEISAPVKERVKRVVKPKPLPVPNPTVWGRIKAKLRGWLA